MDSRAQVGGAAIQREHIRGAVIQRDHTGDAISAPERISRKRLEEMAPSLSERDRTILFSIRYCRYLTTRQIQRLHFTSSKNALAGLRAANRVLTRLKTLGLTGTLARRIGGVRAGSGALIWFLTDAGERLLRLNSPASIPRHRFFEPSPYFLSHTMAVAESYVQLSEICKGHGLALGGVELEPACWRTYTHMGKSVTLKPDLFALTHCDSYEDRWFMEMDLGSEAPVTVLEKCRRYHEYYRTGLEQKQHEVFPLVVWIVLNEARKASLAAHIREEFKAQPKIFIVITANELKSLIRQGVERGELC